MDNKPIQNQAVYIERATYKMEPVVAGHAKEKEYLFTGREELNCTYHINNLDYPKLHTHQDYWDFCIVTEGIVDNYVNGTKIRCPAGTLFFMTTKDYHYLKRSSERIRYINITVREKYILSLLEAISPKLKENMLNSSITCSLKKNTVLEIESLLYACSLLDNRDVDGQNQLMCSALLIVIQKLYEHYISHPKQSSDFLNKLSKITANPIFLTYSVSDLCRIMLYSKAQLSRLFKNYLGISPGEFLISNKFQHAANLLINTDMTLLDIATKIGYADPSHFSRHFKKKYGVPPGEYRKDK